MNNYRLVDDFNINKIFYCDKLDFVSKEGENTDSEKILKLTYEDNNVQFMLKSSIKDVTKYLYSIDEIPIQIEVQDLEYERKKIEQNEIILLEYIPNKEFQFRDCNDFMIKYIQYEIAKLFDC